MTGVDFQQVQHKIPHLPGIYKYYDEAGALIYVGKAKDLRKRVSSYFTKTFTGYKTQELVKRIADIQFTIVNSEQDALLLENALIKKHQPKYNIELKDDKSYPYVVIKKEPFPRVFLTRRKINDGSTYFGPYTSAGKVRDMLNLIKQLVPLRNCNLSLTSYHIQSGKYKPCLEFHLGNCLAPCIAAQTEESYQENLKTAKEILQGNVSPIIQLYKQQIQTCVESLDFEKAEAIKKKLQFVENYQARSVVVSKFLTHVDAISMHREDDWVMINYLMVKNGSIVNTHSFNVQTKLDETDEEVLIYAITLCRQKFNSQSPEIIVPFEISFPESQLIITVPKLGDKKKLLELSETNVNYFKQELKRKKALHVDVDEISKAKEAIYNLQQHLKLPFAPNHIECFDNSNFQGSFPVSAMVCFKEGMPDKENYRHFNIKTVQGVNDFASMHEVVYRRYKRVIAEQLPLPDLVVIDGGKGQLSAAMKAIEELGLQSKLQLVGLAKNEEEVFFPKDSESLKLPWSSAGLMLLRRIRDEVHRFGITFHRNKRSAGTFVNGLEKIPGIGPNTASKLLKKYKSMKNVKLADFEELQKCIGHQKATLIQTYFRSH